MILFIFMSSSLLLRTSIHNGFLTSLLWKPKKHFLIYILLLYIYFFFKQMISTLKFVCFVSLNTVYTDPVQEISNILLHGFLRKKRLVFGGYHLWKSKDIAKRERWTLQSVYGNIGSVKIRSFAIFYPTKCILYKEKPYNNNLFSFTRFPFSPLFESHILLVLWTILFLFPVRCPVLDFFFVLKPFFLC